MPDKPPREKTKIGRAGGIPLYAEDYDVTPNDDLREIIERMENEADYRGDYEGGGVLAEFATELRELVDV